MSTDKDPSPVQSIRWQEQTAIVDVVGDIDINRSVEFQDALLELLEKSPSRVVVNLSQVPYMDSSGMASLVKLLARTRKCGSELCLAGLTSRVRDLFEITRLDTVFAIYPSERDALK